MRAFAILTCLLLLGVAAYASGGGGNETIKYNYDNSGQLVSVARTGTVRGNTVNITTTYSYDHAENRNSMNTVGH